MHARTTTQRGYGSDHQAERRRWTPAINAGHAYCAQPNCLMPTRWIQPGTQWELGHNDQRTTWIGPVHRRCNQRDGASKGGRATAARYGRNRYSQPRPNGGSWPIRTQG